MVQEGSDGLWAWGSVMKPLSYCKTSIPSQQWPTKEPRWKPQAARPKFEQSGTLAVWGGPIVSLPSHTEGQDKHTASACRLLHGLNLQINNPPSSVLAPRIRIHFIWIFKPSLAESAWRTWLPVLRQLSGSNLPRWIKPSWLLAAYRLGEAWRTARAPVLPPSLSLPSPHAVSMEVSQPAPRQPSWQTQCQPFMSRVHLPLPLHKPGHPSARQTATCSNAPKKTKPHSLGKKRLLKSSCFPLLSGYFSAPTWCLPTWSKLSRFGIRMVEGCCCETHPAVWTSQSLCFVEPRFGVTWRTRGVNVPNTQRDNAAFSSTEISTWKLAGKGRHFLCWKMFGEHDFSSIVILGGIHLIWLQLT